jgi:hypothetical protein
LQIIWRFFFSHFILASSSCRHRRTLANDELRTQDLKRWVNRLPVDHAQKHFDAAFALPDKIMVDCGQGRLEKP